MIKAPTRLRQRAFAHQSRLPERNEDDESGVWLRRFRDCSLTANYFDLKKSAR